MLKQWETMDWMDRDVQIQSERKDFHLNATGGIGKYNNWRNLYTNKGDTNCGTDMPHKDPRHGIGRFGITVPPLPCAAGHMLLDNKCKMETHRSVQSNGGTFLRQKRGFSR
ncbi:hypothetical protein CEXT_386781 [Caerostris extrusa]|uniref:Uncharacterized protein n=1 Tax=Caerostris extrusa TaxID=172846 RepID=A0AAV4NKY2_CAEEX|nr:hypothetical protein CEXT_386781 [Caerostris extrusa]